MTTHNSAGIYLHIPFCKKACTYCNFHFSTILRNKAELVDAMIAELELQSGYLNDLPIETIYFGGGTPSLLSIDELQRIFEAIYKYYPINNIQECTLEANPDDFNSAYLKSLKCLPISRLSIGIQSFHDSDLQFMTRSHDAAQAEYAIKAAQDVGFSDLSIDLIYGIPGLSHQAWEENLLKVSEWNIPHFSAYALTVEEKTALHHGIRNKTIPPVDPEHASVQFELLMNYTQHAGYDHYEISNFALPEHHAIHNTHYWQGYHYLGVGPSAHSYNGTSRKWNIANNALYTKSLLDKRALTFEEEILTPIQQLNEYIMTSIRTMWGCNLDYISEKWGKAFAAATIEKSAPFDKNKWLIQKKSSLMLTNNGKLFADKIAGELFF